MFNNANSKVEAVDKRKFSRIVKSILFSILLTLVLLVFYAILLVYTNIPESTIPVVITFISGLSILISSVICTLKIKNNGIINGGIIGFVYIVTIYLISSIVQTGFNLNLYSIIMIIVSILCGMFGGIIGVNIK